MTLAKKRSERVLVKKNERIKEVWRRHNESVMNETGRKSIGNQYGI